ncbi:MAG TPA: hypothetical protein VF832_12580, partial [Longimicrobiales bacterium]
MRKVRRVLCGMVLGSLGAVACAPAGARAPRPRAVELRTLGAAIEARAAQEAPATVAVSVVDLASGQRLGLRDTVSMHAASTMKV